MRARARQRREAIEIPHAPQAVGRRREIDREVRGDGPRGGLRAAEQVRERRVNDDRGRAALGAGRHRRHRLPDARAEIEHERIAVRRELAIEPAEHEERTAGRRHARVGPRDRQIRRQGRPRLGEDVEQQHGARHREPVLERARVAAHHREARPHRDHGALESRLGQIGRTAPRRLGRIREARRVLARREQHQAREVAARDHRGPIAMGWISAGMKRRSMRSVTSTSRFKMPAWIAYFMICCMSSSVGVRCR